MRDEPLRLEPYLIASHLSETKCDGSFVCTLSTADFLEGILVVGDSLALALNVLNGGVRTPTPVICGGKARAIQDFHRVAMGLRGRSYG